MTTTTTTTTKKKITIPMSERTPLRIDPKEWPIVASASRHDGQVQCQANTEWSIKVREHVDGRRIVYGSQERGDGGQYIGFREVHVGYLVENVRHNDRPMREGRDGMMTACHPDNDETVRAIRRVAGAIDDDALGSECIADLPAEEI